MGRPHVYDNVRIETSLKKCANVHIVMFVIFWQIIHTSTYVFVEIRVADDARSSGEKKKDTHESIRIAFVSCVAEVLKKIPAKES